MRSRLPGQDQKRRLKGVFRLMGIPQHVAADVENHGTVPVDEQLERGASCFIVIRDEAIQQIAIGPFASHAELEQGSDGLHDRRSGTIPHRQATPSPRKIRE